MIDLSKFKPGRDVLAGLKQGGVIGLLAAALIVPPAVGAIRRMKTPAPALPVVAVPAPASASPAHVARSADFGAVAPTDDARYIADWVADSRDNHLQGGTPVPFAILDKRDARVYVFDAQARLIGASPVLLGAMPGDDSADGIGQRPMSLVHADEKTTPAGRFVSAPGRNASGEDVVWVDYGAAVSMHRVRPVDPKERRLERLASNDPAQRRISYGCINVPVAFFEGVVHPNLGAARAVVYVLPERKTVREVFATSYEVQPRLARAVATEWPMR